LVEAGTEQAADLGYGDERYFGALERALDSVVKGLSQLGPDALDRAIARLRRVAARAAVIGWGFGDYVQDLVAGVQEPAKEAAARSKAFQRKAYKARRA